MLSCWRLVGASNTNSGEDNGCYATFAEALFTKSKRKYNDAVLKAIPVLQNLQLFYDKDYFTKVQTKLFDNYKIELNDIDKSQLTINDEQYESSEDPILNLIESYYAAKELRHDKKLIKRKGKRGKVENYDSEIEKVVFEMKNWIVKYGDDKERFFKEFTSIAEKQLKSGHPEHLCKTCCDLASVFIERNNFEIPEQLLEYAEILNNNDPFVLNQKGSLLRYKKKFNLSLEQYDKAKEKFPNYAVCYTGRADVLRDMGKIEESLKEYDEAKLKFPNYVVCYTGRAEVLRDMRKMEESLKQYDEAKLKFYTDVVCYTGRAEVLRDMGKMEESLTQYDEAKLKFPEDVVCYTGRAEVLRDMGKMEESLNQYDEAKLKFPNSVVSYTGRAEVLRDIGKMEESLKQYDEAKLKFPNYSACYTGRAEVLRNMSKMEESLKQYAEAKFKFSNDAFCYTSNAEALRDLGKMEESLKQYDEAKLKFYTDVVCYTGRAEVLRDMGKMEESLTQYNEAVKKFPFEEISKRGRLQVLLEMQKYEDFEKLINKKVPTTKDGYIEFHIYCMYLIKIGEWKLAREKINSVLKLNPIEKHKKYFKTTLAYLNILDKKFDSVLAELNSFKVYTPAQSLMLIHAKAEKNKKNEAIAELHRLEVNKRPIIHSTLLYLSERYQLNGFNKSGKSITELDSLIVKGEMQALFQY